MNECFTYYNNLFELFSPCLMEQCCCCYYSNLCESFLKVWRQSNLLLFRCLHACSNFVSESFAAVESEGIHTHADDHSIPTCSLISLSKIISLANYIYIPAIYFSKFGCQLLISFRTSQSTVFLILWICTHCYGFCSSV